MWLAGPGRRPRGSEPGSFDEFRRLLANFETALPLQQRLLAMCEGQLGELYWFVFARRAIVDAEFHEAEFHVVTQVVETEFR